MNNRSPLTALFMTLAQLLVSLHKHRSLKCFSAVGAPLFISYPRLHQPTLLSMNQPGGGKRGVETKCGPVFHWATSAAPGVGLVSWEAAVLIPGGRRFSQENRPSYICVWHFLGPTSGPGTGTPSIHKFGPPFDIRGVLLTPKIFF